MVKQQTFQFVDGGSKPTSPLQLTIKEITPQLASVLNESWHSVLPRIEWSNITRNTHYVCYSAIYNHLSYAVGIWSSPVAQNRFKNGKSILELRRLAISPQAPKNTASWMIGIMVRLIRKRFPDIERLISYQDTEVHSGTIYKASGWKPIKGHSFKTWTNRPNRKIDQSQAIKIRWEKEIT